MTTANGDTVLLTGGHGFLGSHLAELLLARGYRVRCLLRPGRDEAVFAGRPVDVARGDLRADDGLADAVRGVRYVFHVAGLVSAKSRAAFDEVNAEGTRRLAVAVGQANPGCERFVYVSSQAAAGPSLDGQPIDEERAPAPLTDYGASKLAGERVLPEVLGDVTWSIVRPPAIYGPRDEAIFPFFKLASFGFSPGLEGAGRRFNLLHARDVAAGALAAAESAGAAGRTYFLSDEAGYGYDDVAHTLAAVFGRRLRRIPLPDLALDAAAWITDGFAALFGAVPVFGRQKARELKARWWLCSAKRATAELGWRAAIPLEEGFAETARWYAAAGKVRTPNGVPSPL